jgi:hypothetical protein
MGLLEYAWSVSCQKDYEKARIRIDPELEQPTLKADKKGFNITLPAPSVSDQETISFLGFDFPSDANGKYKAGRLFRACVLHLTAHTLMPNEGEKAFLPSTTQASFEAFSETLVSDVYVSAYILAHHSDTLADLAFANSLAFLKMKPVERILNPATRLMAALLSKMNIGFVKGRMSSGEEGAINQLARQLNILKAKTSASFAAEDVGVKEELEGAAAAVNRILESWGPILELPSLPYTEKIGPCTIFSTTESEVWPESETLEVFKRSLETLGGTTPSDLPMESCWKKQLNAETLQAFNAWENQKSRERKILTRIEEHMQSTRLKSVSFPEEDYTQYRRARLLLRGGSRRLLDSLRVAQDALDEDPRKEMGQLDLTEVIQKVASQSPRTDVFMQNEYLSRSFAWSILYDVSASMKVKGDLGRALAICVAEATKQLLMDPGSWTFFAFSDRLYVLKDASEAYSHRVRARIGGLKFDGLTYMPDAVRVAGETLAKRFDEQRFLVVLSDGWLYGYQDMPKALAETVKSLQKKGVNVIGVGLESERMKEYFRISCSVYNQKDLIKKFSKIYVQASTAALEA